MVKLTIKQKVVLEAIEWYIDKYGVSPTIRDIAELTHTTTHPTHEKLLKLEELGVISTMNGKGRTIKVLKTLEEIENDAENVAEKSISIKPYIKDRDFARGTVSTIAGDVTVCWKKENGTFTIEISSDKDCDKVVYLPDGSVATVSERSATLTCNL